MNIKELIKRTPLFGLLNYIRFLADCRKDAKDLSKYGLAAFERKGKPGYRILLNCHSIEKGLTYSNPRFFGVSPVGSLLRLLSNKNNEIDSFERSVGLSTLGAWASFCRENGYDRESLYGEVRCFLEENSSDFCETGVREIIKESLADSVDVFDKVVLSRKSCRSFSCQGLRESDVVDCLQHFRYSPSACNRQMCRVYWVKSDEPKRLLSRKLMGLGGFDKNGINFFVVTYQMNSVAYSGERHQGYLNAGLASMNFVNALHSRGIGSCFVQWGNSRKDSACIKEACSIPDHEEIVVVIAAGYYPDRRMIPVSSRRQIDELFKTV